MQQLIFGIEKIVWSPFLVFFLLAIHLYFTFKLKFPQRKMWKGLLLIFKKESKSGIHSFQALMTILAGTLGVGNIVGVAGAITIGGIGSVFWIFISGVFAIATKYAETYIPLRFRKKEKGKYVGGAMYVLKEKLGFLRLAFLFSVFVVLSSFGSIMIQANSMVEIISTEISGTKICLAIFVTVIACYIVFGNEKRIASINGIFVPIAIILYLYMCVFLLFHFKGQILIAIQNIMQEAFCFKSVCGGFFSSIAIHAMNVGLSKGLYSNEAGMGSSPLFNVSVEGSKSIEEESLIASTSVFIDTVILCTITGVILVASNVWQYTDSAISLVRDVFEMVPGGKFCLNVSIAIFAISTLPCIGYNGLVGIKYIFHNKNFYEYVYKLSYLICTFVGCLTSVEIVWSISSIFNAFMIFPNVVMLYCLKKDIKT